MGFPRADIDRAMRAAFFNPDRAVEYLLNVSTSGKGLQTRNVQLTLARAYPKISSKINNLLEGEQPEDVSPVIPLQRLNNQLLEIRMPPQNPLRILATNQSIFSKLPLRPGVVAVAVVQPVHLVNLLRQLLGF